MKRLLLILLGVFVLLVIIGLLVPDAPPQAPDVTETAPPTPATPAQPAAGVTMANYLRLETGMSYAQVVAILGKPGSEMSSNEIAGTRTVMYQWEGSSFGANMNAMFQNDKMMQKAQFGLK